MDRRKSPRRGHDISIVQTGSCAVWSTGTERGFPLTTLMLLDAMATSMVEKLARATGLTSPQQAVEEGRVRGELRVALSLSSLRASMACILDRCHQIGDTAGLCAKRREAVVLVEEEMRKQREAQHLARVRGGHLLRRGHILV